MNRCIVVLALLGTGLFALTSVRADDALKPNNLEKLNTDKDEDDPHTSSSMQALFYSSTGPSKKGTTLMVSVRKSVTAAWGTGKPFAEAADQEAESRSVFLTPDGRFPQQLYFATNKDPGKKHHRGDNYDIYYFIKQNRDADFTTETPVQKVSTADDELHPWLTASGKALYFSRRTKDVWKLFVASKPDGGGQWQEPKQVKLPDGFHHATLTPDGKTMYLQGPLEGNRWGIFKTVLSNQITCSTPEPLVDLNNSEGPRGDMSPNLSRDGRLLYFASDRPGGKGGVDLYAIPTAQLVKKPATP